MEDLIEQRQKNLLLAMPAMPDAETVYHVIDNMSELTKITHETTSQQKHRISTSKFGVSPTTVAKLWESIVALQQKRQLLISVLFVSFRLIGKIDSCINLVPVNRFLFP